MSLDQSKPTAKRGRPVYLPSDADRTTVLQMHGVGIPESQICTYLGISPKTLRKHFRKELSKAHVDRNLEVLTHLFTEATSGQRVSAAIFWAKTRCEFRQAGPVIPPAPPKRSTRSSRSEPAPSVAEDIAFHCETFINEGAPNAN